MALYKIDKDSSGAPTGSYQLQAGGTLWADCPLGTLLPFMGAESKIPAGWCLADGRALSRTEYADLFAIIGTAYGAGDGSTTFNIADMRESVPKGAGETGKTVGAHVKSGGLAVGEFLDDRLQQHDHTTTNQFLIAGSAASIGQGPYGYTGSASSGNNSGRSGSTTEVKSVGVNYIIKAKMVAMPSDFMDKVEEAITQQIEIKDVALATDTRQQIAAGGEGNVYSITYTLAQGEKVVGITNLDAGNGWGASEVSFKFFGIDIVSDGVIRLRATVKNLSSDAKSIGCSGHITTIKV